MTDIPIIIPSSGRAATALIPVSGAVLYVDEREADAYREHHPGVAIETHTERRSLAAIRQAIYTRWPSVFMLDDDIQRVLRHWPHQGEETPAKLTADEAHELIQVTGYNAARAGCALWGFSNLSKPMHYIPQTPIRLTGYINGCAMGLHPSPHLYFSLHTVAAESHWIGLLNAATHRISWIDMRFCFDQKPGTFVSAGGQAAHRTLETEMRDTLFLRRMFGQAIQVKRARGGVETTHQYQREMRVPL